MQLHRAYALALYGLAFSCAGQVAPLEPLPQAVPDLTRQIQQQTQRLKQPIPQALSPQQLADTLQQKANLPDPLSDLPLKLDVRTQSGQLAWREVEVEHGFRAVEREWLLLLSSAEWQQLRQRWPQLSGFVQSQSRLEALNRLLIRLKVPLQLDSSALLQQQFNAELAAIAGRNHLYQPQSTPAASVPSAAQNVTMCERPVVVGMVDTPIALSHPALMQDGTGLQIIQQDFVAGDIAKSYGHGTAVAGVFAARHGGQPALLPKLRLYSASAFYASNDYQPSATLAHIIQALNYLAAQRVGVINMSLTGPANPVLAAAIDGLARQQVILVAAAGNAGPAAPALYPAAYAQVLAVTAVDSQAGLYRWANQGDYIDFAALGVKVPALTAGGDWAVQSGTSLAAPVVSAAVACLRAQTPGATLADIKQQLIKQARDLGGPGKDAQFGYDLLAAPLKTQL